jgi:hypothetical protein
MPMVMPQIAVHRLIQEGISIVKANIDLLDDIFQYYTSEGMDNDYGQDYIDKIKVWFHDTKVPVVQAWSMNMSKVPQISVQLAQENEDEAKAAIGDHWGEDEDGNIGVGVTNVMLDVNLFGTKNSDEVLWLYYIVKYILFKRKRRAEELGLQLHTFSATDYARDIPKLPENVWVRTIRFKTTTEDFWDAEPLLDIDDMEVDVTYEQVGVDSCEDDEDD